MEWSFAKYIIIVVSGFAALYATFFETKNKDGTLKRSGYTVAALASLSLVASTVNQIVEDEDKKKLLADTLERYNKSASREESTILKLNRVLGDIELSVQKQLEIERGVEDLLNPIFPMKISIHFQYDYEKPFIEKIVLGLLKDIDQIGDRVTDDYIAFEGDGSTFRSANITNVSDALSDMNSYQDNATSFAVLGMPSFIASIEIQAPDDDGNIIDATLSPAEKEGLFKNESQFLYISKKDREMWYVVNDVYYPHAGYKFGGFNMLKEATFTIKPALLKPKLLGLELNEIGLKSVDVTMWYGKRFDKSINLIMNDNWLVDSGDGTYEIKAHYPKDY